MKRLSVFLVGAMLTTLCLAGQEPAQQIKPVERALRTALASERYAHAYCEAVIAKYGPRPVFARVVEGESLHSRLVEELMFRKKFQIPKNNFERKPGESIGEYAVRLKVPATYPEALQRAAQLERQKGPLYVRLMKVKPKDVQAVFGKLRREALQRDLLIFERRA